MNISAGLNVFMMVQTIAMAVISVVVGIYLIVLAAKLVKYVTLKNKQLTQVLAVSGEEDNKIKLDSITPAEASGDAE